VQFLKKLLLFLATQTLQLLLAAQTPPEKSIGRCTGRALELLAVTPPGFDRVGQIAEAAAVGRLLLSFHRRHGKMQRNWTERHEVVSQVLTTTNRLEPEKLRK
jgi:hypothetical protein